MRYFANIQLPNFAFFIKLTEEYLNFRFYYRINRELKCSGIRAILKHLECRLRRYDFFSTEVSIIWLKCLIQQLFRSYYHLGLSLLIKSMFKVRKFTLLSFLEHTNILNWPKLQVLIFFLSRFLPNTKLWGLNKIKILPVNSSKLSIF